MIYYFFQIALIVKDNSGFALSTGKIKTDASDYNSFRCLCSFLEKLSLNIILKQGLDFETRKESKVQLVY